MANHVQDRIIRRLRSAGGIEVEPDAEADLIVSVGGDQTLIALEVKHRFTEEVLDRMERMSVQDRNRTVLAVPELSSKRREELRSLGVSWIEYDSGVVHVRVPGLAIELPEVPREVDRRRKTPVPSLAGKAGVVVEALIELARQRPLVTQPEVAELSGCTQAWVSQVFSGLVEAGALDVLGKGPRKEWRPRVDELLKVWIEDGGPSPSETSAYVWARTERDLLETVARMTGDGVQYAVAGVAAANLYEPTLTSVPVVTLWIPASEPPEHVVRSLDGEVVESGANLLLWQAPGDPGLRLAGPLCGWRQDAAAPIRELAVVTPGRAVVEALRAAGRGPEVGENLRSRILEQVEERGGRVSPLE